MQICMMKLLHMNLAWGESLDRARQILRRSQELVAMLSNSSAVEDYATLCKEHSLLQPQVELAQAIIDVTQEIKDLKELGKEIDTRAELDATEARFADLCARLTELLADKSTEVSGNAIMEFKPGTGGDEAALFAADLWRMYCKYAEFKGWKHETIKLNLSPHGGVKTACLHVKHDDAMKYMSLEGGVHRVQRIPATESLGRIHTSTAIVCVLPEEDEARVVLNRADLKIERCRSSGAGGQHVNTTDSAINILHIPTGIRVSQQDERSQSQNEEKALRILKQRILQKQLDEANAERNANRASQAASGQRNDKMRTYNYPQNRITDHKRGITMHNLTQVMEGQEALDKFLQKLLTSTAG